MRRGCRLEYFLRPPLHVTLYFQVKVEIYRVDVKLLPCGSASRRLEIFTCSEVKPSKTSESDHDRGEFKLVGRCDLGEDVLTCFKHPNFKLRAPFPECPPDPPAHAKQQELWGSQSLSAVAQLRIAIPYGGGSSALGIKSLAVWGVPARCCSLSELEQFQKAHFDSLQPKLSSFTILSPVSTSAKSPRPVNNSSETTIPEEFLDPLTQELMVLPMILPSGMVVDNSTLEEYVKQEATWGRMPNDPFTGVPFTTDSKPLPNPLLKSRIDSLLLQTGHTGLRSKNTILNKPRPSRLLCASALPTAQSTQTETQPKQVHLVSEINHSEPTMSHSRCFGERQRLVLESSAGTCSIKRETLGLLNKRKYESEFSSTSEVLAKSLSPLTKMPRTEASVTLPTG